MANKLQELSDHMRETRHLMMLIKKTFDDDPLKCLEYVVTMSEHFEAIREINTHDKYFKDAEANEEFIQSLAKFLEVTKKHRLDEKSPFYGTMNKEKVSRILGDLEKRYDRLTE